ncbi:hypothetical protein Chor_014565 [Crotalus horridus]
MSPPLSGHAHLWSGAPRYPQPASPRREHWTLLGNLKATVEGLVSINHPNVWSKYGGLERLCRDMHSILYHGLILDKFLHLHENGQQNPDKARERTVAELWLQHSLQFHCLSAQLKPLLENKQYIRKFYTGEASESRTKSLTALLGSISTPPAENTAHRYLGSFSGLPSTYASIPDRRLSSPSAFGGTVRSEENAAWTSTPRHPEDRCPQHLAGPPLGISGPNDANNAPAAGTSTGLPPNPTSDPWSGSQDETDGPEYLAIGNLGRPSRACDSPEVSGPATLNKSNGDILQYKGDLSCLGQSQDGSTPGSVYVEYDTGQYLHPGEGMFRRPTEGQSLISYLSEQDFGSCADLEKESAVEGTLTAPVPRYLRANVMI